MWWALCYGRLRCGGDPGIPQLVCHLQSHLLCFSYYSFPNNASGKIEDTNYHARVPDTYMENLSGAAASALRRLIQL